MNRAQIVAWVETIAAERPYILDCLTANGFPHRWPCLLCIRCPGGWSICPSCPDCALFAREVLRHVHLRYPDSGYETNDIDDVD